MAKNKQNKNVIKKVELHLFYMSPQKITLKTIKEYIDEKEEELSSLMTVDYWEGMEVLQFSLVIGSEIDWEITQDIYENWNNPSDKAFIKNRQIESIFSITLIQEDLIKIKPVFRILVEQFGGFFCTDSEDFRPIYGIEELSE